MTVDLTKPFHLSRKAATEGIEAALAEKGADYVYTDEFDRCQYVATEDFTDAEGNLVEQGKPLCIVGKVLAHAGFPLEDIEDDEYVNGSRPVLMVESGMLTVEEDVLAGLTEAQIAQDCGETWGDAADKFTSRLKP